MKANPLRARCLLLAIVITAVLVAPARFVSANLITNGDFETGNFSDWTVIQAQTLAVAHPADLLLVDQTFGAQFGATRTGLDAISQTFATTPGAFYALSFNEWVENPGTNPLPNPVNTFDVLWNGVSIGGGLFPQIDIQPGGFNVPVTFILQATGPTTTLTFEGRNQPFFDFLDNVSVTPAPDTGSTLGLLSLALAALFGASRLRSLCLA